MDFDTIFSAYAIALKQCQIVATLWRVPTSGKDKF